MQFLTEQTEEKLGFGEIRSFVISRTLTEDGAELAGKMRPLSNPNWCLSELHRTEEMRQLLEEEEDLPLEVAGSISKLLEEARPEGTWLTADDLFRVWKWMDMVLAIRRFLESKKEELPSLWEMGKVCEVDQSVIKAFRQVLDAKGKVKDSASEALSSIRRSIISEGVSLRRMLNVILREAKQNGWTDGGELTLRGGRLVIPLKTDFKGRIKGFVHDVSQSGQTVFIEPSEALGQNNRLRRLHLEEQNEIRRILLELTAMLRPLIPDLKQVRKTISRLDFVRAKAKLAEILDGKLPNLDFEGEATSLVEARHPLLLLKAGGKPNSIVPLSVELNQEQRILLISGPNAGGKTIAMKTLGLLQAMLQAGVLVPCHPDSTFRWFGSLYTDIGDDQSIASDLSTYTSHLTNMNRLIRGMNKDTLFLVDEFGSGTDPNLGGAIAEAFLEKFVSSGAYGIITTHYGNLKTYADRTEGIVNSAMQFDPVSLSPTYSIEVGVPGRSYAFEIARKVGVPEKILEVAEKKMSTDEVYTEELLLKLEEQRAELEEVLSDNKRRKNELKQLLEKNQHLKRELERNRKEILANAHVEAQGLIKEANRKIENTIREIRETEAEKERTRELRKELQEMLPEPPKIEEEEAFIPEAIKGAVPVPGDWVMVKGTDTVGKLIEMQGKRCTIEAGDFRFSAKVGKLVKVHPPKQTKKTPPGNAEMASVKKRASISADLKVMGLRVEAALPMVTRFMDDALYAGLKEVRILHGKGTGALRDAIREYLRIHYDEIEDIQDAHIESGGAGWTVVQLK